MKKNFFILIHILYFIYQYTLYRNIIIIYNFLDMLIDFSKKINLVSLVEISMKEIQITKITIIWVINDF